MILHSMVRISTFAYFCDEPCPTMMIGYVDEELLCDRSNFELN